MRIAFVEAYLGCQVLQHSQVEGSSEEQGQGWEQGEVVQFSLWGAFLEGKTNLVCLKKRRAFNSN